MKEISIVSGLTGISEKQVKATVTLLEEGSTVPFISRYRKEMTGSLDEVQITDVSHQWKKIQELQKRKETILKAIEEQGKLTEELKAKITNSFDSNEIEDLYLPYKKKRKTKASVARERGLEGLAKIIMAQKELNLDSRAQAFVKGEVSSIEMAIEGARDIIAEWINENQFARTKLRRLFERNAVITSKLVKGKEEEGEKYKDYFDWSEPLKKCASHRMLAIRRGEAEGFLKVDIAPSQIEAIEALEDIFVKGYYDITEQVRLACKEAYKRLLKPSIETEFRKLAKDRADQDSINVFAKNLKQLLLLPPLGQKRILALDPGYKSGCKLVCLDAQGNLLHNETIFPHAPQRETAKSISKISVLVKSYKIQAIAIGNGTASRETESFIKKIRFDQDIKVFVVNEAGASVYSASPIAREEFPNYDVTVRGAVSIGRRLADPLAELVKIDPKSIGVGQYQHDVDQSKLSESLDETVESCVNSVGVNLNTASKHLLTYVSGLGPQLAGNIVDHRKENGSFTSRVELKKVARMGAKSFEQCAGFLRIPDAKNWLDRSAVHPESYKVVQKMAKDLKVDVQELIEKKDLREQVRIEDYVSDTIGIPTLKDILKELEKPGRDPRSGVKTFEFSSDISSIGDLKIGMELPGIVNNVTNFGAFVDIGIKESGLVHISQLCDEYVSSPSEVVSLNEHVSVKVLSVDFDRKRIQLSMKGLK